MSATLRYARYYRDAGLSVIPIRPRDKRPLIAWTQYQHRLATDDELVDWFGDNENNIGVVCGAVSGGLVVLDFDNAPNVRSFLDVAPELEEGTVRVKTARGEHVYLQTSEPVKTFQVPELGLDVKAEGSYVVGVPSIHPTGPQYDFANDCTQIAIVTDFTKGLGDKLAVLGIEWGQRYGGNASKPRLDVVAATKGLRDGNRNDTFSRVVGKLHRDGWTPNEIVGLLTPHAERVDFPLDELQDEVSGICGRYARSTDAKADFQPMTVRELLSRTPTKVDWIWEGYIPVGGFVAVGARPKTGKSTLAYHLVKAVAQDEPFFGLAVRKCPILILALEERPQDVATRCQELGIDSDDVYIWAGPLKLERAVEQLCNWILEKGIRLVVVDTLTRSWALQDISDNMQIAAGLEPVLNFARQEGVAFLFLTQLRKTQVNDVADLLGGTELAAMMDVAIALRREEQPNERSLQAFSRYATTPQQLVVSLKDGRYTAEGEKSEIRWRRQREDVLDILGPDWQTITDIAKAAGMSYKKATPLLDDLVREGLVEITGEGKRGNPRRFRLAEEAS